MQAGLVLADGGTGACLEVMCNTGERLMKRAITGIIARENGGRWSS